MSKEKLKLISHPADLNLEVVKKVVIKNADMFATLFVYFMSEILSETNKQDPSKPQSKPSK